MSAAERPDPNATLSAPVCLGPDCPYCSGEQCLACGAGIWRWPVMQGDPPCEHDSAERHARPEGD